MSTEYFEAKNIEELCALLCLPKSQAPKVEMRRDLVIAIRKMLEERQLTHAAAAKITGAGRTVITAIANGNLEKISTDRLIDIADALGLNVHLKIDRKPTKPARAKPVRAGYRASRSLAKSNASR